MNKLPKDDLIISLLQHEPTPTDIDAGIERLEQAASDASAHGSDILLTPECGITGYDISQQQAQTVAFARRGPTAERIAVIARRYSLAILYGFMEADNNTRYNSVQLVSAEGETLLNYRKTHLWGDLDRALFSAGEQLAPVVSYQGWQLSTLICYDVEFPETLRALALGGAELILVPTALMHPYRFVAEQMIAVRAAENQVFLAYANLVGKERNTRYEGCSVIAGPEGNVLARAPDDKATLIHAQLQADAIQRTRTQLPYHNNRRPELYGSLSAQVDE
ncbi:MAG: carbon-nitrogen hydrolase family protein [Granulosicoccus sp.]